MLSVEHVSLAVIYADSYSVEVAMLTAIGLTAFCFIALRATHDDVERLACITIGIVVLLCIGLVGTPIVNPNWRGDRLDWIQCYTPWIVAGGLLGMLAAGWSRFRKSVNSRLNSFLTDRARVLAWGASATMAFLVSAATFTFDTASRLMNDSYGAVFEWLPDLPFQVLSILAAILTLPITISMVAGIPIVIILFVGADTNS